MPNLMAVTINSEGLKTLIDGIQSAATWIFSLFAKVVDTITSQPLLLYPVLFFITMGAIGLVIGIVKKFGMKPRTR